MAGAVLRMNFCAVKPPLRKAENRCSRYLASLGILNNGSRADAGAALGTSLRSAPSYNTGLTSIFEKFFPLRGIFQKLRQPCCRYHQCYKDRKHQKYHN